MFIIFDKEKIKSYITIFGIVIMLFGVAFFTSNKNTVETNSNSIDNINEIDFYNE